MDVLVGIKEVADRPMVKEEEEIRNEYDGVDSWTDG